MNNIIDESLSIPDPSDFAHIFEEEYWDAISTSKEYKNTYNVSPVGMPSSDYDSDSFVDAASGNEPRSFV